MVFKKGEKTKNNGNDSRLNANCLNCKKEFKYYLGKSNGFFCCRECYNSFVKIPEKECIICGKLYTPDRATKDRWTRSKYCSLECLNISKFKGKNIICKYCHSSFWVQPSRIQTIKFCSKKCYNKSMKGHSLLKKYKKGYRAEKEAMKILKNQGYIVLRNFLSWGVFDIVAIGFNNLRFIQCKSSSKKQPLSIYKKDIDNLFLYNVPDYASKELWVKQDYKGWKKYLIVKDKIDILNEEDLPKTNKIFMVSERLKGMKPQKINDLVIELDKDNKTISFIQCGNFKNTEEIQKTYDWLNDEFVGKHQVVSLTKELNLNQCKEVIKQNGIVK